MNPIINVSINNDLCSHYDALIRQFSVKSFKNQLRVKCNFFRLIHCISFIVERFGRKTSAHLQTIR